MSVTLTARHPDLAQLESTKQVILLPASLPCEARTRGARTRKVVSSVSGRAAAKSWKRTHQNFSAFDCHCEVTQRTNCSFKERTDVLKCSVLPWSVVILCDVQATLRHNSTGLHSRETFGFEGDRNSQRRSVSEVEYTSMAYVQRKATPSTRAGSPIVAEADHSRA